MIIYVFWVWLLATLFFLAIETVCLSFLPAPQTFLAELLLAEPSLAHQIGQPLNQTPLAMTLFLAGSLALLLVVLGYLLEWKLTPIRRIYLRLQKTYPAWYQRWPAPWREIYLVLLLGLGGMSLLLPLAGLLLKSGQRYLALGWLGLGWLALWAGLAILPILRYRTLQNEDRPEKPPQALLHNVAPKFPLRHSLVIGQFYLRLILPLFCLFLLLIPVLGLGQSQLSSFSYALLFTSLPAGLGLSWLWQKESNLDSRSFRDNLFALGGRLSLSGGLLLFGISAENALVLVLFGLFAGIFAGSY